MDLFMRFFIKMRAGYFEILTYSRLTLVLSSERYDLGV